VDIATQLVLLRTNTPKRISATRGYWKGLKITSNSVSNELSRVIVSHAGGDGAGVTVGSFGQLRLANTLVEQSSGDGLSVGSNATLPGFSSNTFRNNTGVGVKVPDHLVGSLDVVSSYLTGNGTAYIEAFASGISNTQTWSITAVPIRYTGSASHFGDLTLAAGTTVQFAAGAGWSIRGSLTALGTPTAKIRLVGADSSRGIWKGIDIAGNTLGTISHAEILSGGGPSSETLANVLVRPSQN
jgi:hypothetical protein